MGNRLCEKKIREIEYMLKIGKSMKEIKKTCNISMSTIRRISIKEYPRYYRYDDHVVKVHARALTLSNENIVSNFFKIKKIIINEIYKIINYNNYLIIYTDCYSSKYKKYRVKFLFRNCNVFFFQNLENMRIMCFKFGDFISRSVRVLKYE